MLDSESSLGLGQGLGSGNAKLKGANGRLEDYWDEFIIPKASSSAPSSAARPKGKEKEKDTETSIGPTGKKKDDGLKQSTLLGGTSKDEAERNGPGAKKGKGLALGNIVQDEVEYRKKEALGMTKEQSEGRTLGGVGQRRGVASGASRTTSVKWPCLVCTL